MGSWLFRHRGLLPVPLLAVLLLTAQPRMLTALVGMSLMGIGELLRLWGVAHIGARSRTRTAEVGELVRSGPFRYSRNPLYVGNILLFSGVAAWGGSPTLVGLTVALLLVHYGLIIRWEEGRLAEVHGPAFVDYAQQTFRWVGPPGPPNPHPAAWRAALISERSTFVAIALVGTVLRGAG